MFLLKCWINLLHTYCFGTRLCIRSCLYRELTASQLVDIVIRSDTGSHNRLDLIQSLIPTRYVCNGYVYHSTIIVLVHSKSINSQHYRVRVFPSWLVVTVCFLSWAICLPVECCCNELTLNIQLMWWNSMKQKSSNNYVCWI